jgi:benzoyl-CoA reductase/2-hydroxyglutaryl-CoA dehydratase subunit BcrC/BadD/HgdB
VDQNKNNQLTAFDIMQKHYQQRDVAALEWKNQGGKVVGYLCSNVPEELILAAGFFPLRLSGDPNCGTDEAEKFVKGSRTQEEFSNSIINMLLTGKYRYLDFLVIPHARDSVHKIFSLLQSIKASNPGIGFPELYFMDNLHTTFYLSQSYNHDRWFDFLKKLEEWSGKGISQESLSWAISISNENRMLLKKVSDLRAATPPRISGVDALQIIGSSMFMHKEEHNKLLRKYLNKAEALPIEDGVRIFVGGSPLDNLQIYKVIESCGAVVVAEDNCWGNRAFDKLVDTSITPPFEAVVDRYNNKAPCPRIFPLSRRIDYCVDCAVSARAQGAIFYSMENDPQAWDIPDEIKKLNEKGIPSLYLKNQPYLISQPDLTRANIKEFIEFQLFVR